MSISYLWKLSQFPEKVECAIHFRRSAGSFIGIEKCDTPQLAGKYSWEYIFPTPKGKWSPGGLLPPPKIGVRGISRQIDHLCMPPTLMFLSEQENSRHPRYFSWFVVFSMILQDVAFRVENGELDNWRKSGIFIQFVELWLKHCQRHDWHKGWVLSTKVSYYKLIKIQLENIDQTLASK